MDNKINIEKLSEILLRFLSRPRNYYGNVTLKFNAGKIKNITATDSFDILYLSEKQINIGENEMSFTKFGAPTKENKESSKILSEVEVDENKNIIKESKIIKQENAEDKEN